MKYFGIMEERKVLAELTEGILDNFVRPNTNIKIEETQECWEEYCYSGVSPKDNKGFVAVGMMNDEETEQMNQVIKNRNLQDIQFPLVDTHRVFSCLHEIGHIITMHNNDQEHARLEKMFLEFMPIPREEKLRMYREIDVEKDADDYAERCLRNESIRKFIFDFLERKSRGL